MTAQPLTLFVWEDVLRDYTPGMVAVLARDVEEARRLVYEKLERDKMQPLEDEFGKEPIVATEPTAFIAWGGG